MTTHLRELVIWLATGSTGDVGSELASLHSTLKWMILSILGLAYTRYVGILGADPERPAERRAYDALRDSLIGGNLAARLYAERLTSFLDAVDRFFGDAGMADRTLFPCAFGLRNPAPLWTAVSFDRCLLLAFIYPFVMIFLIWAISGHVGPVETALHLKHDLPGWRRGLAVALLVFLTVVFSWHYITKEMYKPLGIMTVLSSLAAVNVFFALSGDLQQPALSIATGISVGLAWCFMTPGWAAGVTAITFSCLTISISGLAMFHLTFPHTIPIFSVVKEIGHAVPPFRRTFP
jgi:hypothetical protein